MLGQCFGKANSGELEEASEGGRGDRATRSEQRRSRPREGGATERAAASLPREGGATERAAASLPREGGATERLRGVDP